MGFENLQPHRARYRIKPRAVAFRADFAIAFLPVEPRLLDGVGPRAPVHFRQIKKLPETPAAGTPPLRRIVTEVLRIERLEGTTAAGAGTLGRMDGNLPMFVLRQEHPVTQAQCVINKFLGAPWLVRAFGPREAASDNFHVVFAKAVQSQALVGLIEFSVRPDLGVTMPGGPFGHVGMEALAIPDCRRQQQQIAALFELHAQPPAQFFARLSFNRRLAVRTKLRSQAGE